MDRQKAALVVVRIEQRELLMAVRHIAGVVNIENDAGRRAFVRRHPLIDERVGQAVASFSEGAFSIRDNVGCEHSRRSSRAGGRTLA